jgi:hypothetical protein
MLTMRLRSGNINQWRIAMKRHPVLLIAISFAISIVAPPPVLTDIAG